MVIMEIIWFKKNCDRIVCIVVSLVVRQIKFCHTNKLPLVLSTPCVQLLLHCKKCFSRPVRVTLK